MNLLDGGGWNKREGFIHRNCRETRIHSERAFGIGSTQFAKCSLPERPRNAPALVRALHEEMKDVGTVANGDEPDELRARDRQEVVITS